MNVLQNVWLKIKQCDIIKLAREKGVEENMKMQKNKILGGGGGR